jgi:hypothetical protein
MATSNLRDTKHRYAPSTVVCGMRVDVHVQQYKYHPPGTHAHSPIVDTTGALELVTELGSRWYGCDRAYINAELRMVVIGFDARDEVRAKWTVVPKKLQCA